MKRQLSMFLALVALIAAAIACGGSARVTIDDIATFPSAQTLATGQSTIADLLAESIAQSAGQEGVQAETRLYSLPAGTPWADVKSFYTEQAANRDWTSQAELTQESAAASTIGWTRGGLASEQALVIAFAEDPFTGEPFLVIILFSE